MQNHAHSRAEDSDLVTRAGGGGWKSHGMMKFTAAWTPRLALCSAGTMTSCPVPCVHPRHRCRGLPKTRQSLRSGGLFAGYQLPGTECVSVSLQDMLILRCRSAD